MADSECVMLGHVWTVVVNGAGEPQVVEYRSALEAAIHAYLLHTAEGGEADEWSDWAPASVEGHVEGSDRG